MHTNTPCILSPDTISEIAEFIVLSYKYHRNRQWFPDFDYKYLNNYQKNINVNCIANMLMQFNINEYKDYKYLVNGKEIDFVLQNFYKKQNLEKKINFYSDDYFGENKYIFQIVKSLRCYLFNSRPNTSMEYLVRSLKDYIFTHHPLYMEAKWPDYLLV